MRRVFSFLRRDSGAVSVDWVVLTAGVAMLAATTIVLVTQSTSSVGEIIRGSLETVDAQDIADNP